MNRAVGYIRISKAETRSHSLEYQEAEIRKAATAFGYEIVSIYSDNGISGKTMNRPGIIAVQKLVIDNKIDAVICFKSDRISRNGIDSVMFESLLASKKVAYISVTEGLIGAQDEDPLMPYLRGGLNQRERMIISLRTRKALSLKKEKGEKLGANPYGQDDQEQRLVERIHYLHQLGYSSRKMLQVLTDEGFSGRRGKLHKTTILNILNRQKAA